MNLSSPTDIRNLLQRLECTPRRTMGQHFLADRNILELILRAANLEAGQRVLEIGPGLGVVTEALLEQGCRLVAIEKDRILGHHLQEYFRDRPHLELRIGDALEVDWHNECATPFQRWISNLPYGAGSRLLVELSGVALPPEEAVLMVQRDVAERLLSEPGTRDYGLLTLAVSLSYEISLHRHISPGCFVPRPGVWSSLILLRRRPDRAPPALHQRVLQFARRAFSGRRKQMHTLLRRMQIDPDLLQRCAIDSRARPEVLHPDQWLALAEQLPENSNPEKRGTP